MYAIAIRKKLRSGLQCTNAHLALGIPTFHAYFSTIINGALFLLQQCLSSNSKSYGDPWKVSFTKTWIAVQGAQITSRHWLVTTLNVRNLFTCIKTRKKIPSFLSLLFLSLSTYLKNTLFPCSQKVEHGPPPVLHLHDSSLRIPCRVLHYIFKSSLW